MLKVKIDDSGLRKLTKSLEELARGEQVALHDLLNQQFMKKYTEFNSLEEMLKNCPLNANTVDEFEALAETKEWNDYIRQHTRFDNWQDMLHTAVAERVKRKLSG